MLLAVGGLNQTKSELLNLTSWDWKPTTSYPNDTPLHSFSIVSYKKNFYITGGVKKLKTSEILKFHTKSETWKQLGFLNAARSGHFMTIAKDKIYLVGGSKNVEICSLDKFDCIDIVNTNFTKYQFPQIYNHHSFGCPTGNLTISVI